MREILFRGKTIDGKWVYGAYVAYNWHPTVEDGDTEITGIVVEESNIIDYEDECLWNLVIPETAGQYTGLTDKNGKKIFEGDIVEINEDLCTDFYVCFWNEYNYEFGFKNKYMDFGIAYAPHDIEVIGNIHDNPELLKGGAE